MANYITDISGYFENLCANHPDLLHTTAVGQRVYQVVTYEEALGDFRTAGQEKTFFVRLILPTMQMVGKDNNATKKYQAGIMVGRYYSRREQSQTEMVAAWADAERISDDFMARILYDSRDGHPLFNRGASTVEALDVNADFLPAMGDGSFAAVLYTFNLSVFRCLDAEGAGFAAWTDL